MTRKKSRKCNHSNMTDREKDTLPPTSWDERALAFSAMIAELDKARAAKRNTSSGMLRIRALAEHDLRCGPFSEGE